MRGGYFIYPNGPYADFASFPAVGTPGVIYVDLALNDLYLWTGAVYELQSGSGGGNDPRVRIFRTTSDVAGAVGVDQALTELSCTLTANKHYYIEVFLRMTTASAALWAVSHRPTYTGTIVAHYATVGGAIVSNQNILSQPPASATLLGSSQGANNTDFSPAMCFSTVSTGGSDTTWTHAFRSGAVICTAKSGSHMRVTELS